MHEAVTYTQPNPALRMMLINTKTKRNKTIQYNIILCDAEQWDPIEYVKIQCNTIQKWVPLFRLSNQSCPLYVQSIPLRIFQAIPQAINKNTNGVQTHAKMNFVGPFVGTKKRKRNLQATNWWSCCGMFDCKFWGGGQSNLRVNARLKTMIWIEFVKWAFAICWYNGKFNFGVNALLRTMIQMKFANLLFANVGGGGKSNFRVNAQLTTAIWMDFVKCSFANVGVVGRTSNFRINAKLSTMV